MYYVYILYSEEDKLLYTGFTDDLKSRYNSHSRYSSNFVSDGSQDLALHNSLCDII